MSSLLLRKSLDFFQDEDKKKQSGTSSQKKSQVKKVPGMKIKKGKKRKEQPRIKDSIQDLQMKCVLDEVKKRKDADLTLDNISVLLNISKQSAVGSAPIDKIAMQQKGRLAKNLPAEKEKPKEKPIFSEEDFAKFEKYYFVKLHNIAVGAK